MTPYTDRSINKKLLSPILMLVTLIFFSYQVFSYYMMFEREKESLIKRINILTDAVTYDVYSALLFEDYDAAAETLSIFSADTEFLRVKLYTLDDHHVATYRLTEQPIRKPTKAEIEIIQDKGFVVSSNFAYLRVPIHFENNVIAYLRVTISKAYFNYLQATTLKSSAIFLIILFASCAFFYHVVQRIVIRPIHGLNSAIQGMIYGIKFKTYPLIESEDEFGHLVRCFSIMTERLEERTAEVKKTLDSLKQETRRQRIATNIFENSQEGLLVMNQDHVIAMVNPAITEILGFAPDELINRKASEVFDWHQFQAMQPIIAQSILRFGQWKGEITETHKKGHPVPLSLQVRKIYTGMESNSFDLVFMFTDLTDIKEVQRLEYLAHHDSLTGLINRAKLYHVLGETIERYLGRKGCYGVIYLDLDGFKQINDRYGHDAGDEVLKQVSNRLTSSVRNNDWVARLAGDEFVVVLDPIDEEGMHTMCHRITMLIQEDILYHGQALHVGASLGGYLATGLDNNIDAILKASDSAMYQAKMSGKGRHVLCIPKWPQDAASARLLGYRPNSKTETIAK